MLKNDLKEGVFKTMEAVQHIWTEDIGWHDKLNNFTNKNVDLSFVFGGRLELEKQNLLKDIKEFWPKSIIIGCSTAGEIYNDNVLDDSVVVTNIIFNKSKVVSLQVPIKDMESSYESGIELAKKINKKNLKHIMIFSEGIKINGTKLIKGLCQNIPNYVTVSGGLAGDGERFQKTITIFDDFIGSNTAVCLCFAFQAAAQTLPLKTLPDDGERYYWWYHQVQTDEVPRRKFAVVS